MASDRVAAIIVAAIIVKDNFVALIERSVGGLLYYLFPGGGVESNESLMEAMVREVREELGLDVEAEKLVAEVSYRGTLQYYFVARITGGTFGTGHGLEIVRPPTFEEGTYAPVWVPLSKIREYSVHPKGVVELVLRAVNMGWPPTPLKFMDPGRG